MRQIFIHDRHQTDIPSHDKTSHSHHILSTVCLLKIHLLITGILTAFSSYFGSFILTVLFFNSNSDTRGEKKGAGWGRNRKESSCGGQSKAIWGTEK